MDTTVGELDSLSGTRIECHAATRWTQILLAWLAASALLFIAYFPALRGDFIWDDDRHISQNPSLVDAGGLYRIWLEPGATPQYYPLTHATFWIEHQLWGNRTTGYHIDNVLLHALSAVLAWQLMKRLNISGAMFIAALWAFHPLQVESVAWMSERKNVLSFVFYLAALLALQGGGSRGRWILSFAFFVCAMLSKTVACSEPAVAMLLILLKRKKLPARICFACFLFRCRDRNVAGDGAHGTDPRRRDRCGLEHLVC